MQQEKTGLFPDLGDQLVEVIRRGRASARTDTLRRRHAAQKSIFLVVDQFALLPFLDRLDDEAKLLADLIIRLAVQIRHPGMDIEDGIDRTQIIFAGIIDIVHESLREDPFIPA